MSHRPFRGAWFVFAAALCMASTARASAPSDDAPGASAAADDERILQATERYKDGRRLLNEGKPAEALVAIEASLEALPSVNTELLKAHALRLLGRRAEALLLYEHVMDGAGARVRAGEERFRATLADAGRWAAELRAGLGELVITVAHPPRDVSLSIDGAIAKAETDPATGTLRAHAWHEPGRVRIVATTKAGAKRSGSADLKPGTPSSIHLDFGAPPPPPPAPVSHGPPLASWVAAGVGVLGFGAFAVFGSMAESADSELTCSPNCTDPALRPTEERRDRNATIANVSLAVGATGIVTAGIIWIISEQSSSTTGTASRSSRRPWRAPDISVSPRSLSVRGSF